MATHDGSKANKGKDPGESCRRLLSAVCEKLKDEREKYNDELTTDSEDCSVILRIEEKLNAPPDCDELTEYYKKLSQELQMVTKRINGRKYARQRYNLVKELRSSINKISRIVSARPFLDKQRKIAASQANNWRVNKLNEQESVSIYEDHVLTCPDLQNWINKLVEGQRTGRTSPRRPDLGEVKGLFASETTLTGSSREEHMTNIFIPSRPIPTGQTLFEIFSVDTNLSFIKTIVLYDYQGGTLVYKSKEGDKDRFIRRRSIWLSKHIEKKPSDFIDSLVLRGPTRPMTADAGCWIIEMDVPVKSTFEPEDSELCGKVFKTTLSLSDDYMDKPRCSLISIRGGFVNISSITFSTAVRSTIRFVLDGPLDVSSVKKLNVRGELTLSVEDYDAKFTIFKSHVLNVIARVVSQTTVEIPLLRHVLALPVGSRVHVKGLLKLRRRKVLVDEYLVLDKEIVRAEWLVVPLNEVPLPSHLKARISIELCDYV